ncbi:MAG: hypothetical protein JW808_04960 [Victivallales bacterium]|nr:hypothetical protein [Victivallales bacterium]
MNDANVFFRLALTAACLAGMLVLSAFPVSGDNSVPPGKAGQVKTIVARRVEQGPMIDGLPMDPCWIGAPVVKIPSTTEGKPAGMTVRACNDGENIFLLIQYKTDNPRRTHRPWLWDPLLQAYVPGEEREETFSVVLAKAAGIVSEADIWVWRAARTDPVAKADDMFYLSESMFGHEKETIGLDCGLTSWFSRYFGSFSGMSLPRFFNRSPSGSMADVDAKGRWDKKTLSIEFGRKLHTGNEDDITLGIGEFSILLLHGNPSEKIIQKGNYVRLLIE